jgi:hypothetical protein
MGSLEFQLALVLFDQAYGGGLQLHCRRQPRHDQVQNGIQLVGGIDGFADFVDGFEIGQLDLLLFENAGVFNSDLLFFLTVTMIILAPYSTLMAHENDR